MKRDNQSSSAARLAANLALFSYLMLLLSALPLRGQAVKASLVGTVTDSSGAVVPGAEITITEVNTNFSRSTTANESGYYVFSNLNPGVYRVEAKLTGFKTAVKDKVEVLVNTTVRADLQLQPGAISEVVTVSAEAAPLLQTDRSDIGRKIEARQMQEPVATATTCCRLKPTRLGAGFTSGLERQRLRSLLAPRHLQLA